MATNETQPQRAIRSLEAQAAKPKPRLATIRRGMQMIVDASHPAVTTASYVVLSRLSEQIQELSGESARTFARDRKRTLELDAQRKQLEEKRQPLTRAHTATTDATTALTSTENYQEGLKRRIYPGTLTLMPLAPLEQKWKTAMVNYGVVAYRTDPKGFVEALKAELAKRAALPTTPTTSSK